MTLKTDSRLALEARVDADVRAERDRQLDKWGVQHRANLDPSNMHSADREHVCHIARLACDQAEVDNKTPEVTGGASWEHIIKEELAEAAVEAVRGDKVKLRKELVQCAAVIVAWIEDLDAH